MQRKLRVETKRGAPDSNGRVGYVLEIAARFRQTLGVAWSWMGRTGEKAANLKKEGKEQKCPINIVKSISFWEQGESSARD